MPVHEDEPKMALIVFRPMFILLPIFIRFQAHLCKSNPLRYAFITCTCKSLLTPYSNTMCSQPHHEPKHHSHKSDAHTCDFSTDNRYSFSSAGSRSSWSSCGTGLQCRRRAHSTMENLAQCGQRHIPVNFPTTQRWRWTWRRLVCRRIVGALDARRCQCCPLALKIVIIRRNRSWGSWSWISIKSRRIVLWIYFWTYICISKIITIGIRIVP